MHNSVDTGIAEKLKDRIVASERCVIMLVGGSDTGKTTLVEQLADALARSAPVAIVDADMGQSHIGPPTTIGWGLVKERFLGWDAIRTEEFYFVGATSPYSNLLPTVVGTKRMCDAARAAVSYVVVDTTGLITGSVACILKWNKIDAIQPDIVLAVRRNVELEPILAPYAHTESPVIIRMQAPQAVAGKTVNHRAAHRERMFARYFENSNVMELSADRVSLRCAETLPTLRPHNLVNRLASLRGSTGRDMALGILVEGDSQSTSFSIRTPLTTLDDVSAIVIGGLRISPDGKQLGAQ